MNDITTPPPVMGVYDHRFWESVNAERMRLQRCASCGEFRYPPGPVCAICLSSESTWEEVEGQGEILSWVIFHRTYLPAYPAPYNVIAVRLTEGPIIISNLEGDRPAGSWVGESVKLIYSEMPDGVILPRFVLSDTKYPSE